MNAPTDTTNEPSVFKSIGGGRYEPIDCPTGRCPRVNVAELPYERQIDESDDHYAIRLRKRARIATDTGNHDELYAIFGALQTDIGVPEDGISVPCRTQDEWLALAFMQGVHPDAWRYAEFEEVDLDKWFNGSHYETPTLKNFLRQKMSEYADSAYVWFTFVGPDGLLRRTKTLRDDLTEPPSTPIEDLNGSVLRHLIQQLAQGMGLAIAGLENTVQPKIQFANLQTTEPPMHGGLLLWEYESEEAPGEANHGENIILANNGPIKDLTQMGRVPGPLAKPTGRLRTTVGASNAQPRPMAKTDGNRPPTLRSRIPQWLKQRFERGRRNEARALESQNLPKNNQTVTSKDNSGNTVRTIPDSMPPGRVVEVKDVRVLSNTRQIQAQANYAKDNNLQYTIYTGPRGSTTLTGTMQALERSGAIRIERLNFLGKGD